MSNSDTPGFTWNDYYKKFADQRPLLLEVLELMPFIEEPSQRLTVIEKSFEEISTLPQADLIYASFSLPFCRKDCSPPWCKQRI